MNNAVNNSIDKTVIRPFVEQDLKIYGYTLEGVPSHDGAVKVGETIRDVNDRIKEQVGTVGLKANLLFQRQAKKKNGDWFHDKDLHRYFLLNGIERMDFNNIADEWFYFNGTLNKAWELTDSFINLDYDAVQIGSEISYILRDEQQRAVDNTYLYYSSNTEPREFLWNAKPRFGKTLTTYDFLRKIKAKNTLIITNRPAIANSWYDDFEKFIAWQEIGMKFVSETDALKNKAMSRNQFVEYSASKENNEDVRCVAFVSLQDLKGAKFAGGEYDKLNWIPSMNWDLLVIDEAHEGVDTIKSEKAFDKIKREFTLHLSGTPFKAIANLKFRDDQIYNWSYFDEQNAKLNWDNSLSTNPYAPLPTLNLFTYQMSKIIADEIKGGTILEDESVDFAFDLNEFFKTKENDEFEYKASVIKFLDNLTKGKFPFAKSEYRHLLNHTLWLLPRVASAKALEKLLKENEVFSEYKIILAAGDGLSLSDEEFSEDNLEKSLNESLKSYDKVKNAIAENEKTITLTVGQLTTGVTIPEWSGVLILSNIKSPSLYFQASFRAQNPCEFVDKNTGELFRKENAYIFDFAPDRTLVLFDEFANNLSFSSSKSSSDERTANIRELLNFFPVIAEDEQGKMHEIDAEAVLTIPNKIKALEVVRRGFMSNLLFVNISAIFSMPSEYKEILDKIQPVKNNKQGKKVDINVNDVHLNDDGEIEIPKDKVINTTNQLFGDKIFKDLDNLKASELIKNTVTDKIADISNSEDKDAIIQKETEKITKDIKNIVEEGFNNLKEEFNTKNNSLEKTKKEFNKEIESKVFEIVKNHAEEIERVSNQFKAESENLTDENALIFKEKHDKQIDEISDKLNNTIAETIKETLEKTVENEFEKEEQAKKKSTEDEVREHLRGFSRTIPAFLMAYGDENTTLATFDKKIDEKTFEELTSITIEEFRQLRDGITILDENGDGKYAPGLFDEVVFNASIKEFMNLKSKLANFLDTENNEDIFDYIPPQKTNQIFTPKAVVKMMVDMLESENPDIFEDKNTKFVDLYTKSGLYITEIIKRLIIGLKVEIPDENERIEWILENQVYAFAPSNIIYNMVNNYVYGGFDSLNLSMENIVEYDLTVDAMAGKVNEKIKEIWGDNMQFDVVIGNPPYQEETKDTSDTPIYNVFMSEAYKLSDKACFITPARFLFNAGKTPKAWNQEMLNDEHLKVTFFEQDSSKLFPNTDIKGGVAITYRDTKHKFGKIGTFTVYDELNSILHKVVNDDFVSINTLIYAPESYRFSKKMHEENPDAKDKLSQGHLYDITTTAFDRLDTLFFKNKPEDQFEYLTIYGRKNNERLYKWIRRDYIDNHENLEKHKVFVPASNGSGVLGEVLSSPIIGEPMIGHTQTFISIGAFETAQESNAVLKYIKTKFARAMLGILKVTQHNKKETWGFVPLQDFTDNSDIDWSKSVAEIDEQLFEKYSLDDDEKDFIRNSIKEMK